jgi:hypothetical protein
MTLNNVLASIDSEIATLTKARELLAGTAVRTVSAKPKHKMSATARKRISDAQRKRWAAFRKAAK